MPWKAGLDASTPTLAPVQPSSTSRGGGAREEVRIAVEETPEPETPEPKSIPQAPQVTAEVDLTANNSPAAKVVEAAYLKQLEARAKDEADERAAESGVVADPRSAQEEAEVEGTDAKAEGEDKDGSPKAIKSEEAEAEAETPKPTYHDRVVSSKHFDTALNEIRPSSSEEGTLPELRKWAEQYGEGGKKAGKKSGFGKGFGFGELPIDKKKGFGRVTADE